MPKKITIYDIANKCDVSTATVSRVLNKKDYPISEAVRKKVIKAAQELNYVYRGYDKRADSSNKIIGIIIPNVSNNYYAQLIEGIQEVALKNGYNTIVCNSNRDKSIEKENVYMLAKLHVKGIILIGMDDSSEHIKYAAKYSVYIITVEQKTDSNSTHVGFNFRKGGAIAAQYLINMGHKKIGYIGAPLEIYSRIDLYDGFISELDRFDLKINKDYICLTDANSHSKDYEQNIAREAILLFHKKGMNITALFCSNDMIAIPAIEALKECGYQVPGDVSVIGFDNIPLGKMITPKLTTIDQCIYDMSALACYTIIRIIESGTDLKINTILEPALVEESSVKKINPH